MHRGLGLERVRSVLAWAILTTAVAGSAPAATETMTADGVSITYNTSDFSEVRISEDKARPADKFPGYEVNPASLSFHFDRVGTHMTWRDGGSVSVVPLLDRTRPDLNSAFPNLPKSVEEIKTLLLELKARPDLRRKEVPTISFQNAGQSFLSHVRPLKFPWGEGFGYLAQYSQDLSPYVVGARLEYRIEALSGDGAFGVTAFFPVKHPSLPPADDDETMGGGLRLDSEKYQAYLHRMERLLDGKSDDSFVPSLTMIQKLVRSVRVNPKADLADWNSAFSGTRKQPDQATRGALTPADR